MTNPITSCSLFNTVILNMYKFYLFINPFSQFKIIRFRKNFIAKSFYNLVLFLFILFKSAFIFSTNKYLSSQTIRPRAHELELHGHVVPEKSCLNTAKQVITWKCIKTGRMALWKHVLWSDEWKYNLFGSDGKLRVWQIPKKNVIKCRVPNSKAWW